MGEAIMVDAGRGDSTTVGGAGTADAAAPDPVDPGANDPTGMADAAALADAMPPTEIALDCPFMLVTCEAGGADTRTGTPKS
jgi:hypothetical protein